MFTAAPFMKVRIWKQPKCPSREEWLKKMWYIHTMEYYSAIRRNEIGSFVEIWMDLETVTQSEVSQKKKNKYSILTHICGIWVSSGSWWWTGKPSVLQSMGLQRVGYDWATELNWTEMWDWGIDKAFLTGKKISGSKVLARWSLLFLEVL